MNAHLASVVWYCKQQRQLKRTGPQNWQVVTYQQEPGLI